MSSGKLLSSVIPCILLVATALSGCSDRKVDFPIRAMPDGLMADAVALQKGQDLFMAKCASCHGKPSEGRSERANFFSPPAPDFTDVHYLDMDPAYLFWRVEVGKTVEPYRSQGSVMPAWGVHFTEQETWQLVAYMRSRAH